MEIFSTKSWSHEEQLEELARFKRNREIVRGVITSIGTIEDRDKNTTDESSTKKMEIAFLTLENGSTVYCPADEFSEHEFRSLNGFAGTIQEFLIDRIDLDLEIALVSIKKADEIKRNKFLAQLEELEKLEQLHEFIFDGTITGINRRNNHIFVRVEGVDCVMHPEDYSWERVRVREQVQRGEKIKVKILRFNKGNNVIRVSKRHTEDDPFEKIDALQGRNAIAGKVVSVEPIHGIFIKLDGGFEAKGIKPEYLEEPAVGDVVSCVIRSIDKENRRVKVVITGYPRGKKQRKDVAAFLFE